MSIIRTDKNVTASALFGVAAIQIFIAGIYWFISGAQFDWIGWLITFSGAIYIALGIVARWIRLPAAIIGSVLYAAYLAFQAMWSMDFIFKIPVVILLLVAVVSALKHPAAKT
jgi:hypothetical protein